MAYSVNWNTKVVYIPKADLTVVSVSPEIYQLDLVVFWSLIHTIQESEGLPYADIMRSNPPVTLAGQTYVRTVEIINGYKVEFEDGQYQVNLTGANNNLLEVKVQNQVSVSAANSAGAVIVTSGSGLSTQQSTMLQEVWKRLGLDPANPLVSTTTQISSGDIEIAITGDGVNTSTATRQP